jgi:hypothetical protein
VKPFHTICAGSIIFVLIASLGTLPAQAQDPGAQPAATGPSDAQGQGPDQTQSQSSDRMLTPPVVSGQSYPTAPLSEERSNYLRGGLNFNSAYTDNAVGAVNGHAISDVSYSFAPSIALDETTPRMHLVLSYAPGFTAYQRESYLNETDQNGTIDLHYRLSPHVTLSAKDGLQKTSSIFNQPDFSTADAVSAGAQAPNFSVIAPIADLLRNSGNVGVSYQFSANGMVGASGTFSNLHYANPTQVSGLYDASTQGGSTFYSLRLSKKHYIGATYQYQRLVSYPTTGTSETQTHAVLAFYTLYASPRLSFSFFGGPQYSNTIQPPIAPLEFQPPAATAWTPAAGGSLSWQGRKSSFALSYSHVISGGGGLIGAVHMDNASVSFRQQITRALSGSIAGGYVQNDVIGALLPGTYNGHTLSATASLQRQLYQNIKLQLGYTRLHQDYGAVAVFALTPDTNREFLSISYQFSRPLGR